MKAKQYQMLVQLSYFQYFYGQTKAGLQSVYLTELFGAGETGGI